MLPAPLLSVIQYAAAIALLVWMGILLKAFYQGKASVAYCAYMLAHNGMFIAAYALIEDINTGWLAINIWHNAQYIGFVWFFNANRFKRGVDPENKALSWLSQPQRFLSYFSACFLVSTLVYYLVQQAIVFFDPMTLLPLGIIVYQTINFHHYIVDSRIWKLRKPKLRANLGLS